MSKRGGHGGPPLGMPSSHIEVLVPAPAAPLPFQLPTKAFWGAADEGPMT